MHAELLKTIRINPASYDLKNLKYFTTTTTNQVTSAIETIWISTKLRVTEIQKMQSLYQILLNETAFPVPLQ